MQQSIFYRLYRFDADGHVLDYKALTCRADSEAVAEARALAAIERQELWSGSRLLAVIDSVRAA
jgi:hypothetical protein